MIKGLTLMHDCGDPNCVNAGKRTCALCDDLGPPLESPDSVCECCGVGRDTFSNGFGALEIFAVFQCDCGQRAAMATQPGGNAAMVHESPRCARFDALNDQRAALAYFRSLPQLELTPEVIKAIERNTHAA